MREILFRGKRVDNGEWAYGDYWHLPEKNFYCISDKEFNRKVDPETVGQFTGLTDKNGKKIFEGDIIKIISDYDYPDDYRISKVYVYNGVFCVDFRYYDFDSTALAFLVDYIPDGDFEVIGKIHDNPELLEVKE